MEDRHIEPNDDLLERALAALEKAPVLPGPPPAAVARVLEVAAEQNAIPLTIITRIRIMKRIAKMAVAATVLAAIGILVSWLVIGDGATNVAFARVAEVLNSLQSATYDITSETKKDGDKPPVSATGKGFFLAPSRQRTEISMSSDTTKGEPRMIMIADNQTSKGLWLMPQQKFAMAMDTKKMRQDMLKSGKGVQPDMFEVVRRLVREGSSGTDDNVEKLGTKDIDGCMAVGFRIHSSTGDMTLWADPKTAGPVRIEFTGEMLANVQVVMSNFRYDVALDPSLFSLEPPEGYTTQTVNWSAPVEEDLLRTLRTIAEHGKGLFPAKLGMSKEVMQAVTAAIEPAMKKFEAKYDKDKLKAVHGDKMPPAVMADYMKTVMPLLHKEMLGIVFYTSLKPANDPHYVGGGVKLGTPDRPILWYKPTGAEKYRVIYADLSVKEVSPEAAKTLSEGKPK